MWLSFLCCLGAVSLYVFTVKINLWNLYGSLPALAVLENPESKLSSELYAADGVLLGRYFRHNRSPVAYEEISPNMINALLATEDHRFEAHAGIDPRGLYRAFLLSVLLQRNRGGGVRSRNSWPRTSSRRGVKSTKASLVISRSLGHSS